MYILSPYLLVLLLLNCTKNAAVVVYSRARAGQLGMVGTDLLRDPGTLPYVWSLVQSSQ